MDDPIRLCLFGTVKGQLSQSIKPTLIIREPLCTTLHSWLNSSSENLKELSIMHSFKSYSVNRWLTGFLCLSLLVSILASSTGFFLRGAAAQGNATLKTGSKLGTNLPDLASIRYQTAADPKAPNFPATSSVCFDCKQSSALD